MQSLKAFGLFVREIISNPGPVGAASPSGPFLGQKMASHVNRNDPRYILELGAGTGAITSALLRSGIAPERLVPIERSEQLSAHLRSRFPVLNIIQGDAAHLKTLIKEDLGLEPADIQCIVSGLPLRSLPKDLVSRVLDQVQQVLPEGGRFIQFTYDIRPKPNPALKAFRRADTSVVWANFPPARVDLYEVPASA